MNKPLSVSIGLPSEDTLPEDEEVRWQWYEALEKGIEDILRAGVCISLGDWEQWTATERSSFLAVKAECEADEEGQDKEESGIESLGDLIEQVKKEYKEKGGVDG
jgi:hypothetical protein